MLPLSVIVARTASIQKQASNQSKASASVWCMYVCALQKSLPLLMGYKMYIYIDDKTTIGNIDNALIHVGKPCHSYKSGYDTWDPMNENTRHITNPAGSVPLQHISGVSC